MIGILSAYNAVRSGCEAYNSLQETSNRYYEICQQGKPITSTQYTEIAARAAAAGARVYVAGVNVGGAAINNNLGQGVDLVGRVALGRNDLASDLGRDTLISTLYKANEYVLDVGIAGATAEHVRCMVDPKDTMTAAFGRGASHLMYAEAGKEAITPANYTEYGGQALWQPLLADLGSVVFQNTESVHEAIVHLTQAAIVRGKERELSSLSAKVESKNRTYIEMIYQELGLIYERERIPVNSSSEFVKKAFCTHFTDPAHRAQAIFNTEQRYLQQAQKENKQTEIYFINARINSLRNAIWLY